MFYRSARQTAADATAIAVPTYGTALESNFFAMYFANCFVPNPAKAPASAPNNTHDRVLVTLPFVITCDYV